MSSFNNQNLVAIQPKLSVLNTLPEIVRWNNVNVDGEGAPFIGAGVIDGEYKELYANGKIYTKDNYRQVIKEEKIDFDILLEAVSAYREDNSKVIRIENLLKKQGERMQIQNNY